jgi:hypothetical protein
MMSYVRTIARPIGLLCLRQDCVGQNIEKRRGDKALSGWETDEIEGGELA